ncbi:Uncharacterized protein PECH_008735 [Penicillium ucsense]|uniref:Rhodopsin domain-containing protein n=1 Tax=Penicillium ucsense TaxID=2839758 RepID=A0A8J8W4P7_9EURO|nr:Uncharacterized protein PECM_007247 [Penicillium ucsense]KAF7734008.1 Uncharacterized protein PECH_008735 [Penicillium ucsense]
MELPPGVTPAFLAEDRRQPALIGIIIVTTLSFIVVMIRLYVRKFFIRELGWDDYFILMAQLTSWATMGLCMMILHYGSGKHLLALVSKPEELVKMYKWLVATQVVYMFNLWLCRVSGLAFYARLNPMPQFILYLRLSFAFITAVYIAQTMIIALQCIPLSALWGEGTGKCMGSKVVFISTGALTIACDSLILLLPVKIVMGLQAKMARKLALLLVLCFGIFASVLRLIAMIVSVQHPDDATWYFSPVIAWTCAEISAAIIALSLPALRAIFGFLKEHRSKNASYSNSSEPISLDSVSKKKKNRVFHGNNTYEHMTEIDGERSASQEVLWNQDNNQKIRVTDTVRVDVRG